VSLPVEDGLGEGGFGSSRIGDAGSPRRDCDRLFIPRPDKGVAMSSALPLVPPDARDGPHPYVDFFIGFVSFSLRDARIYAEPRIGGGGFAVEGAW
jgi:hypothetical protein